MKNKSSEADNIYSDAISSENYTQGIEKLNHIIAKGAHTCKALQFRSHLHSINGDKIQAKRDLNEAIELEPTSSGLYYDRGCLHHQMKEYYLALKDFCEAVNLAHKAGDDDLIHAAEHHFSEILEDMVSK